MIDPGGELPFGAKARSCDSVMALDALRTGGEAIRYATPYALVQQGAQQDQIHLKWPEALKGTVSVIMRIDK